MPRTSLDAMVTVSTLWYLLSVLSMFKKIEMYTGRLIQLIFVLMNGYISIL